MKRGGPLRRKRALRTVKRLARKTPLAGQSKKMKKQRAVEREVKVLLLIRDGGCRGRLLAPQVACSGPLDKDEILARGRGGSATDLDNVQLLCRYGHHHWKHHVDPEGAVRAGLSRHSWGPEPRYPCGP